MVATKYRNLKLPEADIKAVERGIVRCLELGLGTYASTPEFIRDAVRRRLEEIEKLSRQPKGRV